MKEPTRFTTFMFRWGIPAIVIVGGILVFVFNPDINGAEGAAGIIGAGLSWLLVGYLFRRGVEGDHERDVEDAAREYLDEHGHWPTDAEYANYERYGRWSPPGRPKAPTA